jgi:hypothetical protein
MKQIIDRYKSKTPAIFNKIAVLGASLAAIGTSFIAAPVPANVSKIAGYLIAVGGSMVAVAKLAKDDKK